MSREDSPMFTWDSSISEELASADALRRARIIHFCPWADRLQDGHEFLRGLPQLDVRRRVSDPARADLVQMARLDCDWHGENVRAFAAVERDDIQFLPAQVVGIPGAMDVLARPCPSDEEWWFVITGQHPQLFGPAAGGLFGAYAKHGVKILYYAFDEASRTMPVFREIAPHLSVLIHDESPLDPHARALLRPDAALIHRSWVANCVPWAAPFCEDPEKKIIFLGSRLGLTAHRQRQIDFLGTRFKDRFIAVHDHSLAVADRSSLGRYQASLCPEGRKFATDAMGRTHTDRPFWSGCLGMAPVSEDSRLGGRLQDLQRDGLILGYPHGDLRALGEACERALALTSAERRRIYEHFNRNETVGTVVAEAILSNPA